MKHSLSFDGIGTHWEIELENDDSISDEDIIHIVTKFENLYSRFKSSSLVSCISNATGSFTVTTEFVEIVRWYQKIYTLTQGVFTPLIGQTLTQSGYDTNYSFEQKIFTEVPRLDEAIHITADNKIEVLMPVQLDFGGVGKGYLIDKLVKYLRAHNVHNFIINGGGDIYQSSSSNKESIIGLEHPLVTNEVIGTLPLVNKSICSSAGNRRKWRNHHHIINPFTFTSPQDIVGTWVVADSALLADTLSTCLFFVHPSVFTDTYTFEYLIVDRKLQAFYSAAFKSSLFV